MELKTVFVVTSCQVGKVEVRGLEEGGLILHRSLRYHNGQWTQEESYTITHVGTGRSIISEIPLTIGKQMLEELGKLRDWETLTYPLPKEEADLLRMKVKQLQRRLLKAAAAKVR